MCPTICPTLRAEERRLQQALNHLLSNAVKFTEAGGTVSVGASLETDGRLLLFVRDTGIGIPEADIERVFEPFTQLDSTLARRFQGAGLGLYVSRALVAGHGGELSLRSVPGDGNHRGDPPAGRTGDQWSSSQAARRRTTLLTHSTADTEGNSP